MTEVNGMSCAEFADVAAELALGVLTGRERADALAHLDHCDACSEHVHQLTVTGEELLGLLPAAEPPPGFETRVLERLGQPRAGTTRTFGKSRHRRTGLSGRARKTLAAAAVAVAVAGSALGGWGLHAATTHQAARPALTTAALVTAGHGNAGQVFLYNGNPRWMYVSVDLDGVSGTVTCQLESSDGRLTTVGRFQLADGYGSWGSPAWVGDGTPVGARLVSANGTVLATAAFPAT